AEKIRDGGALSAQRFDACDARGKQSALGVDHVELAGDAVLVAQLREAQRLGERPLARRFRLEALPRARLADQRGAHLAEGGLDRLLIAGERLLLACSRRLGLRLQAAAGEDWLHHVRCEQVEAGRPTEEVRERSALAAADSGE